MKNTHICMPARNHKNRWLSVGVVDTGILNEQIECIFRFWDGAITEEEFEEQKQFSITKEVDEELQKDSFY